MKTQAVMIALLLAGNTTHYKKSGTFSYEVSDKQQEVITSIAGEEEVKNIAKTGDYILTGLAGEKYVVKPDIFAKRYSIIDETSAVATGECYGMEWTDENTSFESPWNNGAEMSINKGDMLVSPNPEFTEAYRIEREQFDKTYVPVMAGAIA